MKKLILSMLLATIIIQGFVKMPEAEARGRKGSHRVGGRNSHGKGSHYVGGH